MRKILRITDSVYPELHTKTKYDIRIRHNINVKSAVHQTLRFRHETRSRQSDHDQKSLSSSS